MEINKHWNIIYNRLGIKMNIQINKNKNLLHILFAIEKHYRL